MNIYIIEVINALLNNLYGRFPFTKNLRSNAIDTLQYLQDIYYIKVSTEILLIKVIVKSSIS